MAENDQIKAIVQKVFTKGPHGAYAVATSDSDQITGSITFSLEKPVWQESEKPEQGEIVLLSNLRKKRAGWRAITGRFFKPSDEQKAKSKQKGAL